MQKYSFLFTITGEWTQQCDLQKLRLNTWTKRHFRFGNVLSLLSNHRSVLHLIVSSSISKQNWRNHFFSGKYNWGEVHKSGLDKYQKYGDIVKETILPGVDVVWLFDPNDIAKVLNNAGPDMYPQRKSHLGLEKYRKDRPHIYRTGGLLPTLVLHWMQYLSE